ncbi:hypothetical protein [Ralstonia solanacearum]|uniref:hypothetical protein n=1 Tax=Ralstonia solanacearum TaxID=305 RepID=UPI000AA1D56E|nr:hypothetical protein [Ralstonia solanacearum]
MNTEADPYADGETGWLRRVQHLEWRSLQIGNPPTRRSDGGGQQAKDYDQSNDGPNFCLPQRQAANGELFGKTSPDEWLPDIDRNRDGKVDFGRSISFRKPFINGLQTLLSRRRRP